MRRMLPLFFCGLAAAAEPAAAPVLRPADVLALAQRKGGEAVRDELYNDVARWQQVIRGVESGDPHWLQAAQRIKGLRGDASEELTIAVSRALARAPRNVLTILDVAFDADDVCSLNTLESTLGDTYPAALREVQQRVRAVRAVSDPRVAAKKQECLEFLQELERELVRNREDWFER